jgi:hypothetical protein
VDERDERWKEGCEAKEEMDRDLLHLIHESRMKYIDTDVPNLPIVRMLPIDHVLPGTRVHLPNPVVI